MYSDDSYGEHSSDSDGSDWDTPTLSWSSRVKGEVEKIVKDFSKERKNLNCPVCVRKNKRGAVPDIKALVQHCNTVAKDGKKHKKFVEALQKGMEERGLSMRTLEVGDDVTCETVFERVAADEMGKVVKPFVLLVENVPLESRDVSVVGSDEPWISSQLEKQGIKNFSRAGLLPESPNVLTTFGLKARAYAIFEHHSHLELAHKLLQQSGCGREDWKAKEGRLRQVPTAEMLFGYSATVDDMKAFDPSRRVIHWHEVDFKEACYLPEQKLLEQTTALRRRAVELEEKKKKQAELRKKYEEGLEKQRSIFERRQVELDSWKKRLQETELVLENEREDFKDKWKKEVEAREKDFETKMQELKNVDDSQDDSGAAQEKLIAALLAMKDAQEDLEDAQRLHDDKVSEVVRQKRMIDQLKNNSMVDSKKTKQLAEDSLEIQKKLVAIEEKIALQQARVAEASEPKKADAETLEEVDKQFQVLEKFGLSIDSLDHFDCAECQNSKCKQKLLKPPPKSAQNTPNYKAELLKSRSLLVPCCCAIYCMRCARYLERKKMKCPRCKTAEPVKAMEFCLFGYRD